MYFHPVLEQDPLLQVDWESESESTNPSVNPAPSPGEGNELILKRLAGDNVSVVLVLVFRLQDSKEKAQEYKTALTQALADLQDMRQINHHVNGT